MRPRVVVVLLVSNRDIVKTVSFAKPTYIGDPINTIRIFNEKEVDEIAVLDISATSQKRGPDFEFLSDIAAEAFMPLSYGGGVQSLSDARSLFRLGFEKVVVSTAAFRTETFLHQLVDEFGSSSIVVCLDVKRGKRGEFHVVVGSGTESIDRSLESVLGFLDSANVGEVIIQSIDRDGTASGYDIDLIRTASEKLSCQLVALGGAGSLRDFRPAISSGASAVGAGSLFCFYGPRRAVLINYPEQDELKGALG